MGGAEAPNRQPVSRRIASPHLGTHLRCVTRLEVTRDEASRFRYNRAGIATSADILVAGYKTSYTLTYCRRRDYVDLRALVT
jgi:hypothetical protein